MDLNTINSGFIEIVMLVGFSNASLVTIMYFMTLLRSEANMKDYIEQVKMLTLRSLVFYVTH